MAEARLRAMAEAAERRAKAQLRRARDVAAAGAVVALAAALASDAGWVSPRVHAAGLLGGAFAFSAAAMAHEAASRFAALRALPALLEERHYAEAFALVAARD